MGMYRLAVMAFVAGLVTACGGGGSESNDGAGSQDTTEAAEIEHDDLGVDVLLRTSGKGLNPSSSTNDRSDVELPLADQEAFEDFAELGTMQQDCDTGSLSFSYTSEVTTNPIRVDLSFDMEADNCAFETIVERDGAESTTIESMIDGLFSTGVAAELTGSTAEDLALESLVIEIDIAPESSEQVSMDGFEFDALINEYSLRIALDEEALVMDGIEDVTTSIVLNEETTEIDQTFVYEDLTFALESEDSCPQSGTVSGSVNGTEFEVSFADSMIEVSITGEGTENYTCEQLIALLDEHLEVTPDEELSEEDAMDRAYANAAYGSATNFATNMMFSQGIVF